MVQDGLSEEIIETFKGLPGQQGLKLWAPPDAGRAAWSVEVNPDERLFIASVFKGFVLAECLRDPGVTHVVVVGRRPTGVQHAKLREIVEADVTRLAPHEAELRGLDACFFCLGVSAAGMSEARYTELTYDLALAAARELARVAMTCVYVSGMGTDSSEKGRSMWARVKGRTENALMALPFRAAYMFRPGLIHADEGGPSSTTAASHPASTA